MHILYVVHSSVVFGLTSMISSTQPGTAAHILAAKVKEGILSRRKANNAECLMAERFAHVATMLSPAYKLMTHMQHVQTYSETDKDALLTVANAFGVLAPEEMNSPAGKAASTGESSNAGNVNRLLSNGVPGSGNGSQGESSVGDVVLEEYRGYLMTARGMPGDCHLRFWRGE